MSKYRWLVRPFFLSMSIFIVSCGNSSIGVHNSKLRTCPTSPNCVSTAATEAKQKIAPFKIKKSVPEFWQELQQQISALPKAQIITADSDYLHAECRSKLFSFIDDLEFLIEPDRQTVSIRSAARLGYSDMGVNRKRVETLRKKLTLKGVIE